jgi:hypothetical protein
MPSLYYSQSCKGLRELDLSFNEFTVAGLESLDFENWDNLTVFHLSENNLGDAAASVIASWLSVRL